MAGEVLDHARRLRVRADGEGRVPEHLSSVPCEDRLDNRPLLLEDGEEMGRPCLIS